MASRATLFAAAALTFVLLLALVRRSAVPPAAATTTGPLRPPRRAGLPAADIERISSAETDVFVVRSEPEQPPGRRRRPPHGRFWLLNEDDSEAVVRKVPAIFEEFSNHASFGPLELTREDYVALLPPMSFNWFQSQVAGNRSVYERLVLQPSYWSALRRASPRLLYLHNTLPRRLREDMLEIARPKLARSQVISANDATKHEEVNPIRTSYGMFITEWRDMTSPANTVLRVKIAAALGLPEENIEATQVLRYEAGQFYKAHLDAFDAWDNYNLKRGGQRIASCVTWLNDVSSGGETTFPKSNLTVAPRAGDTLCFYDVDRDMNIDEFALHGGSPPAAGQVKLVAVNWCHPKKFV